jgi:hypothetical protein
MNITTGEVLVGIIAVTVIAIGIVVKVLKNGILLVLLHQN